MRVSQKGFTLIEMVLVVGLLAVAVGVTNDILISLIRANTKTQVINEIEQQSNFVALKIEKELRDTKYVNSTLSNSTTLVFTTRDDVDVKYSLDNGVLKREIGGQVYDITSNVNPGGVTVSCIGDCFEVVGTNPQVVNIRMEFKQAQADALVNLSYKGSAKIESSIVIRNTY